MVTEPLASVERVSLVHKTRTATFGNRQYAVLGGFQFPPSHFCAVPDGMLMDSERAAVGRNGYDGECPSCSPQPRPSRARKVSSDSDESE